MFEGYRVVTFESKVTIERALQDVGSPARIIIRSSVDNTQGNNILPFIIIYQKSTCLINDDSIILAST
jgi:hypothetical protein